MGAPYEGDSTKAAIPGLRGKNTAADGVGVYGDSQSGRGVVGVSHNPASVGVWAFNDAGGTGLFVGTSGGGNGRAALFQGKVEVNDDATFYKHVYVSNGMLSVSEDDSIKPALSVQGQFNAYSKNAEAAVLIRQDSKGPCILALNIPGGGIGKLGVDGIGVWGETDSGNGVLGLSHHPVNAGVSAVNDRGGYGLWAETIGGQRAAHFQGNVECQGGVFADSQNTDGIFGKSHSKNNSGVAGVNEGGGVGVYGASTQTTPGDGVQGHCWDKDHSGVAGFNHGGGVAVFGSGTIAGRFVGDVEVYGNLNIKNGGDVTLADCAEDFDIADAGCDATPGSVMVLDDTGAVRPSSKPYDKCAVGVVSGAGPFRPAIVLDRTESTANRKPIALIGKVCCKVDATFAPVEVGDLLTTSPTIGHAMKATDPTRAYGAVVGKALEPLKEGRDLIRILVMLL